MGAEVFLGPFDEVIVGLLGDLIGTRRKKKKVSRRSRWIADGTHQTKRAATKRATILRKSGYRTRITKLPNGSYYVFKQQ
jgi:hypothetical protein